MYKPTETQLCKIVRGFIACALWATTDDNGDNFDDSHDSSDLTCKAAFYMTSVCEKFANENADDLALYAQEYSPSQGYDVYDCFGHDLWFTMHHHGVGFWDRGLGELGERLTKASQTLDEIHLFYNEENKIEVE